MKKVFLKYKYGTRVLRKCEDMSNGFHAQGANN